MRFTFCHPKEGWDRCGCRDDGIVREAESRTDDGCCRRAGVSAARDDAVTTTTSPPPSLSPLLKLRELALGRATSCARSRCSRRVKSSSPRQPVPRVFAVARRCSESASNRAMRRRCRACRTRTSSRSTTTEYSVKTTAACRTMHLRCRIRRKCRPKSCCCDDGATCRVTSNSIRTSSPATDRSWRFVNASVVSSTYTMRPSTSWRTVRVWLEFLARKVSWLWDFSLYFNLKFDCFLYIHWLL